MLLMIITNKTATQSQTDETQKHRKKGSHIYNGHKTYSRNSGDKLVTVTILECQRVSYEA